MDPANTIIAAFGLLPDLALKVMPICAVAGLCFGVSAQAQTTVQFSGYVWDVRQAGTGGPGPNCWDPKSVQVDASGRLHLRLTRRDGQWRCAEVSTQKSFGFGRYEFDIVGPLDKFDPNVVLGLFDYPNPGQGPDGTNEIDIEYSRWGKPSALPASATIYPATAQQAKLGPPAVSMRSRSRAALPIRPSASLAPPVRCVFSACTATIAANMPAGFSSLPTRSVCRSSRSRFTSTCGFFKATRRQTARNSKSLSNDFRLFQ